MGCSCRRKVACEHVSLQPPVELEGVGRCVAFSWSCTQFAGIEVLQVTVELGHTSTGMPLIP